MSKPTRRASKQLSANDLSLTGSHQAGILVPKSQDLLTLFPRLDSGRKNPDVELNLYAPSIDLFWPARLVFYNTRDLGIGTRSEYRITKITGLLRALEAHLGDRLTFERTNLGRLEVSIERTNPSQHSSRVLRNGWTLSWSD